MAFIKAQKLQFDAAGQIIGGSAAIVDTIYGKFGSYHAKHTIREKLGKVLYLSADKKTGVFLSPTRGLVEYNASCDRFQEVERGDARLGTGAVFPESEVHTVFGDAYLLLEFLEKVRLLAVLQSTFSKKEDLERVLCHLLHGVLKDGAKISCDNFLEKSFASYVLPDVPLASLKSDTAFFSLLGNDQVRMAFFQAFVAMMQKTSPRFGKGCYVDSTPLPNDLEDNPFNALCSHGLSSSEVMTRLVLVLDEGTGLPVWYELIPGNVLDLSTVMNIVNNVSDSLGIEIESLVLDAGYVSQELVGTFHRGSAKTIIGRMPARRGYPFKELYWEVKPMIGRGKYAFVRRSHTYFGQRREIELFGHREFAYVYVDHSNALKRFNDYLLEHEDEFRALKDRDQDWSMVKFGFFVLVSNLETTPEQLLADYFGRTEIESVIKTSKDYLELLPLSKWSLQTVRGKILHDIMNTIVLLLLRKQLVNTGISTCELFGRTQALMCFRNAAGMVTVETPNPKVREYYHGLGVEVPAHVQADDFSTHLLGAKIV